MTLTLEQLTERQTYIGGSDVGSILGLNPYKSARDVYFSKTKDVEDSGAYERLRWGWLLEPAIAEEFSRRTGLEIIEDQQVYRDPEFDFLGGMIDRQIIGPEPENEPGILEIKLASRMSYDSWKTEYPQWYYAQLQHYLMITGFSFAYFAILVEASELKIIEIKRDEPFMAIMREVCINFWENYVEKGVEPPPSIQDDLDEIFNEVSETAIEINEYIQDEIQEYIRLRDLRLQTEKEEDLLKKKLALTIGNNTVMIYDGRPVLTYKQIHATRFDTNKLKNDHPEIYNKYLKESSYRKFNILK